MRKVGLMQQPYIILHLLDLMAVAKTFQFTPILVPFDSFLYAPEEDRQRCGIVAPHKYNEIKKSKLLKKISFSRPKDLLLL